MFHSAALRLTLWYLAIIMAISLIFSLSLYHVSSDDLGRNVNRQISYFSNFLAPEQAGDYGTLRHRQLNEDLNHLKANLILFNFLVLLSGGAASYWLARRTLQPIEDALDSQTRFASDASHELRTPLTAIQAENEVALRNKSLTKNQAVAVLKSNLEEVAKLKALSEGLLRLSNGNGAANLGPVDIKEAALQAIGRYQKAADAKKIKLVDKTSQVNVLADKEGLVELLAVFIDNAIKYSPAGSHVTLSDQTAGRVARIQISDAGIGIKQTELPHIFDRFYRTDASRHKDSTEGYGLGLAIAKKITETFHGHIEVESTVNQGTTFSVILPLA